MSTNTSTAALCGQTGSDPDAESKTTSEGCEGSSTVDTIALPAPQGRTNGIEVDSAWAWLIVFASFVIQFIDDGVFFCFGIFFVEISKEFSSVGKEGAAWIASIMIACTHAIGPLASILVNRYGCASVSIGGAVVVAVGFGLSYFAQNASTLYVTIGVVCGLGFGFIYLPSIVIVPFYFEKKRALAVGTSVCGAGLGVLAFERVFDVMLNRFGWRESFAITAGIILAVIPFSILYGPNPKQQEHNAIVSMGAKQQEEADPEAGTKETSENQDPFQKPGNRGLCSCDRIRGLIDLSLLKDRYFLLFAICDMLSSIGFNVPYIYLPEIEKGAQGESAASTLLGIMGVANVLSRILFGYLSDKQFVNRLYLYNTILMLAGLGTIASPHLTSIWWLRGYAAFYGTCIGTYTSLKTVILVDLIGIDRLTDALGLFLLVQSVGFVIGPPIVGELYDIYGTYKEGFYFAGTTFIVSGALLFSIPILKRCKSKSEK